MTGKYFVNRAEARSSKESYDTLLAERLWQLDEELVGFGAHTEASSKGAPKRDVAC